MDNDQTPPNANTPYAGALAGVIAGLFVVAILRRQLAYWVGLPEGYRRFETFVVNQLSYTPRLRYMTLPPVGVWLGVVVLLCVGLPLLLVDTNLKLNSNRAGFLSLALVPFILATTGKHSALGCLTGMSPVQINAIHRLLATAIVVTATTHMAYHIESWAPFKTFLKAQLQTEKVKYGLAGYGCLCVVFLGSMYPVRRFCYEIMLGTHLLAFGFIGAIAKHTPYAMRYFLTGLVLYGLNLLAGWYVKSRIARVRLEPLANSTRLAIRTSSPIFHKPGQHLYIHIPSISWFEWHPFTITSTHLASDGSCDCIEIYAANRGNFTRKLLNRAPAELFAFISGPCGDVQALENNTIVSLNAGAGVTYGIRLLREVLQDASAAQRIFFAWSVRSASELTWFKRELDQVTTEFPNRVSVDLFVSGSSVDDLEEKVQEPYHDKSEPSSSSASAAGQPQNTANVHLRRLNIRAYLTEKIGLGDVGVYGMLTEKQT